MDEIARHGGIQRLLDEVGAGPSRTEVESWNAPTSFAAVSGLSGGGPGPVLAGLAAGATFAGAGLAEKRREAKRKSAVALLEEAMEAAHPPDRQENDQEEA